MKTRGVILTITALICFTISFNSCGLMSGKKFKQAIEQADKHFGEKQYENAKKFYVQALEFKPDDKYPSKKIEEINEILKAQSVDAQYKSTISEADNLFKQEAYNEAKSTYAKSLKLKANEEYPKEQIQKIDIILAEIKEQEQFLANPYHIVIGCFAVEANATKLNAKLLSEGYKSRILPLYGGKYNAVTISSFEDNTAAYNNINEIKDKIQGEAWVYKN